jgi:hypothetical protein
VELVIGATLWLSFIAFLLFPELGAPPAFSRMAIGLCGSELLAACAWGWGRDCGDSCSPLIAAGSSAAELQIPLLTAAMFLAAIFCGVQATRNAA